MRCPRSRTVRDISRRVLIALGLALIAGGIVLPSGWLHAGVNVIRATLVLEGLALITAGATSIRFTQLASTTRLRGSTLANDDQDEPLSSRRAAWVLAAVTVIALVARLIHLGDDLWVDEIYTVRQYASGSLGHILSTYHDPNNHLLNSILVHLSISAFGFREWAIRLPAVILGVAAVPAIYVAARLVFDRLRSVLAAGLLAVSYQHIYFSQNARGYAGYMLFGLLCTMLLARGLREDRLGLWIGYIATALLCIASVRLERSSSPVISSSSRLRSSGFAPTVGGAFHSRDGLSPCTRPSASSRRRRQSWLTPVAWSKTRGSDRLPATSP